MVLINLVELIVMLLKLCYLSMYHRNILIMIQALVYPHALLRNPSICGRMSDETRKIPTHFFRYVLPRLIVALFPTTIWAR